MKTKEKLILDYFEEAAGQFPKKAAVIDAESQMSYAQLKTAAEKVGSYLTKHTETKQPIPVFMEKSTKTLAAMYGVVYGGCFYVPISKEQPDQRLMDILHTVAASLVITDEDGKRRLLENHFGGQIALIDDLLEEKTDIQALKHVKNQSSGQDLLYIMFTFL